MDRTLPLLMVLDSIKRQANQASKLSIIPLLPLYQFPVLLEFLSWLISVMQCENVRQIISILLNLLLVMVFLHRNFNKTAVN